MTALIALSGSLMRRFTECPPFLDGGAAGSPRFLRRPVFSGAEAKAMTVLATPLVLTAMINVGMSITDVIMMGWLGPEALAAGAIASDFYSIFVYLGMGIIAATSPMIAQARGAGRSRDIRRAVHQGFWVAALLAVAGFVVLWRADVFLRAIGIDTEIVALGTPYAKTMAATFVPMMGIAVWRNLFAAHDKPVVMVAVTAAALPLNAAANWVLMFGAGPVPALGLVGAGIATVAVSSFMLAALTLYAMWTPMLRRYRLFTRIQRPDWPMIREIVTVGWPIGVSTLGEVGVFLISTVIIGLFGTEALAAHAVVLRASAVIFALPLGLSQAATVRTAYNIGAGNDCGTRAAAWTGLGLGALIGAVYVVAIWATSDLVPWLFLDTAAANSAEIAALAASYLVLLAMLEFAECLGFASTGVLRGFKDTRVPMMLGLLGYWAGFAVGLLLAFDMGMGGWGVWCGLALGTTLAGALSTARLWRYRWQPARGPLRREENAPDGGDQVVEEVN